MDNMDMAISESDDDLFQMVRDFIESGFSSNLSPISSLPFSDHHSRQSTFLTLQEILWGDTDDVVVVEILEKISMYIRNETTSEKPMNPWVIKKLQMDGYEASLCRASWLSTFGRPKGRHEYVEVNEEHRQTRLIVDMDFRSQFELARPTSEYKELTDSLPLIFVGSEEKLNKIVSLVCSAAKRSLKEKGLHVPPWRKASYMRSKWQSKNCIRISVSPNNQSEI